MRKIVYYQNILEYKKTKGSGLSWDDFKDWKELCRFCLDKGLMTFENACLIQMDGCLITVEEMIEYCTGKELNAKESLPRCICKDCLNKLSMLYKFKIQCERAEGVVMEIYNELGDCGKEPDEQQSSTEITPAIKKETVTDKTEVVDLVAEEEVREDVETGTEDIEVGSENVGVVGENIEAADENIEEALLTDFHNEMQEEPSKTVANLVQQENEMYEEKKEAQISDKVKLIIENDLENLEDATSTQEETIFVDESDEAMQTEEEEEEEEDEILEAVYEIEESANDGQDTGMEEGYLIDGVYLKTKVEENSNQDSTVVYHLSYNNDEKPSESEKEFISLVAGTVHQNSCMKNTTKVKSAVPLLASLACAVCNETFEVQRLLVDHVQTKHPNMKAFKCRQCDAMFSHMQSLSRHTKSHNARNCLCLFCGKSFFRTDDLSRHLRTHTGERPYPCKLCSKAFKQPSELREHEMAHTKEKRFKCEFCGLSLTSRNGIFIHRKRHHPNELAELAKM